jgi:hypothetical protein
MYIGTKEERRSNYPATLSSVGWTHGTSQVYHLKGGRLNVPPFAESVAT